MVILSRNLHMFIKVAETGNITEAAKAMFVSQPAVSKAISLLEDELHIRLFIRDRKNGMILTNAGKEILKTARQMVSFENRLYQIAFQENNYLSGTVKIAARPILTSAILSKVLGNFRKKYPHINIELVEGESMELNRMIEEHQVDFGLTFSPFNHLENKHLMRDRPIAISRSPFSRNQTIDLNSNHESFIICQSAVETIKASLGNDSPDFSGYMIVRQPETVIKLSEADCGIGVLSELAFRMNNNDNLYVHTVIPSISLEIALTAVNFKELTPAAKLMIDEILDTYR